MDIKDNIITVDIKYRREEEESVKDTLWELRKKRNQTVLREDCKVTVIIQAYNRLEKTKECVESVLKYTKDIPYRLLLLDNGSKPDMMEYFKQVEHEDKLIIHLTQNARRVINPILEYFTDTEFSIGLTNDIVVTENWLKNLLICAESDEKIGAVCPVSTHTSNLQEETLGGFSSLEEMQEKASKFNKSDPSKWEERMRLAFVTVLSRKAVRNLAGGPDTGIYHDFGEDDLCIRYRRAGFKLVLCKDTFVHHNHDHKALSQEEVERFNASIANGKKAYMEKYGLEPWDDFNNYLQDVTNMISFPVNPLYQYEILGIDTRCGTPIFDISNLLRKKGCFQRSLQSFTTKAKYYTDLLTVCEEIISDKMNHLLNYYQENQYDFVVLGEPVNQYENPVGLLERLLKITKKGGTLLFPSKNTYDVRAFFNSIKPGCIPREEEPLVHLHRDDILGILKLLQISDVKVRGVQNPIDPGTQNIAMKVMEASKLLSKPELDKSIGGLFVDKYWFCVTK